MRKGDKAPNPPDPVATAAAQEQTNRNTAITQQNLNMVDQVTPYGNLTYQQIGSWEDGTPRYQATQTLSPEQMGILESSQQAEANLSNLAVDQSARLGDLLSQPVDLSNEAVEGRLMDLGRERLDPALDRRREEQRNSLIQQGFAVGSEGYNRAMEQVSQAENDAYNQLLLTGRGQAVQEVLATRNQPINEITALLSGSQVSQPNFVNTPQSSVAGVDRAGLEMSAYNSQLANWQADQQRQSALYGGLFNLGSSAIYGLG